MPNKMVRIVHPELGTATVPESAFRSVWADRGYELESEVAARAAQESAEVESTEPAQPVVPAPDALAQAQVGKTPLGDSKQKSDAGD